MPRQHVVTDVHLEVGDRVLVRGVRACVRMETATQVLVVFDQAQGGQQEEWVPKNSPSLRLAPAAAAAHAAAAAAAAAARREAGDPDEEMSSAGEDDECAICGNGGKHQPACPEGRLSSATARCPGLPRAHAPHGAPGAWLRHRLGLRRPGPSRGACGAAVRPGRRRRACCTPPPRLTCCDICPRVYHLRCLPTADVEALKEMGIKKMGHRQTIVGAVLGKL